MLPFHEKSDAHYLSKFHCGEVCSSESGCTPTDDRNMSRRRRRCRTAVYSRKTHRRPLCVQFVLIYDTIYVRLEGRASFEHFDRKANGLDTLICPPGRSYRDANSHAGDIDVCRNVVNAVISHGTERGVVAHADEVYPVATAKIQTCAHDHPAIVVETSQVHSKSLILTMRSP